MAFRAAMRQVLFAGEVQTHPKSLTLTGDLITDAVRTLNVEGDGLTPPAGVGIWPGATNLVTNGGFESNTTGWVAGGNNTIARSTDQAKFGAASLRCTFSTTSPTSVSAATTGVTLTAAAYTASVWIYIPTAYDSGSAPGLQAANFSGATGTTFAVGNLALRDQWQRVSITFTPDAGDLTGDFRILNSLGGGDFPSNGAVFYADGYQVELGSIATPYIETDGGTASRSAGRVQLPMTDLATATQGWVVARLVMGFDAAGTGEKYIWSWRTDNNNRLGISYGRDFTRWQGTRLNAGAGSAALLTDNYGSAGVERGVAYAWTSTAHKVSFNGSAFTSASNSSVPSVPTNADIGTFEGSTAYIDSNVLWLAIGSGTLTDAHTSFLNNFGDRPPRLSDLIQAMPGAVPTSVWSAETERFEVAA